MSDIPGVALDAAKNLGGLIQSIFRQEAEGLHQDRKTDQALVDCLTEGLNAFIKVLFHQSDAPNVSPADFIASASTDPALAREVIGIFDDEPIDADRLKKIAKQHGLDPSIWPPKTWKDAAGKLGSRFLKAAARQPILEPYFEAGERIRRFAAQEPSHSDALAPRQRYLQQLIKDASVLDLVRLTSTDEGAAITLKQVLIELDTTARIDADGNLVSETEDGRQDSDQVTPLSALAAFERDHRMILLGDPGSGKSTFAKELAILLPRSGLRNANRSAGSLRTFSQ